MPNNLPSTYSTPTNDYIVPSNTQATYGFETSLQLYEDLRDFFESSQQIQVDDSV